MSSKELTSVYTSPFDIPYIKKLIFSLNTFGAWPYEVMGHKKWFSRNTTALFIWWLFCLVDALSYSIRNANVLPFLEQGRLIINLLMCSVGVQRITICWLNSYKDMTNTFINKMHLFHHKDKNYFTLEIYNQVEKMSEFLSKILHFELYFGWIFFNLTPLYNSYQNGMFQSVKPANATYDQACFYDVPFDFTTDFTGFLVIFVVNCAISFDVASSVTILDLYLCVMIFHLWGHLKILKHNLMSFPKPEMKGHSNSIMMSPWYNEEESRHINELLIENIEHYKIIKQLMKELSQSFGAVICYCFLFHQVAECILLVELSQMSAEAFGTFGILTISLFQQLIQLSTFFELIGSLSATLKDAVYDLPWECMNTKNRKLVLIYLCNVQRPMNFKALGMLPVGVQTMASVLKTTLSYYMLLQTSTELG